MLTVLFVLALAVLSFVAGALYGRRIAVEAEVVIREEEAEFLKALGVNTKP